jgi:FixJ family two-component response regulator
MVQLTTDFSVFLIDRDIARRDEAALMFGREGLRFQLLDDAGAFLTIAATDPAGCVLAEWIEDGRTRMSGLDFARRLAHRGCAVPLIFFGVPSGPAAVRDAFRAGASDFLISPFATDAMLNAVRDAFATEKKRSMARRRARQRDTLLSALTEREREVASLAAQGHDNQLIGKRLGISHRTVEVHKSRLMRKIGARSLADLIRLGPAVHR